VGGKETLTTGFAPKHRDMEGEEIRKTFGYRFFEKSRSHGSKKDKKKHALKDRHKGLEVTGR